MKKFIAYSILGLLAAQSSQAMDDNQFVIELPKLSSSTYSFNKKEDMLFLKNLYQEYSEDIRKNVVSSIHKVLKGKKINEYLVKDISGVKSTLNMSKKESNRYIETKECLISLALTHQENNEQVRSVLEKLVLQEIVYVDDFFQRGKNIFEIIDINDKISEVTVKLDSNNYKYQYSFKFLCK